MKRINKRFMKKLCSVCVAFAMVLSVTGSPVVTAYASEADDDLVVLDTYSDGESGAKKGTPTDAMIVHDAPLNGAPGDIEIATVDVTITIPKVGEVNPSTDITVNGEGYTASVPTEGNKAGWQYGGGNLIGSDGIPDSGNEITLNFDVTPKEGYTLTPNTTVTVNGSVENVGLVGDPPASSVEFDCYPQLDGTIDVIELSDVPTPVVGEKATAYSATATNYSVAGTWYLYDTETNNYNPMDAAHTFANGNIYKLELVAKSNVGYEFAYDVQINSNVEYDSYMNESTVVNIDVTTSFATVIDEVSISKADIPQAEIGKTFEDKIIEIPVPKGSNYKVVGYWIDEEGNRSGTFENGKAYEFIIEIYPNAGYCLSSELELYIDNQCHFVGYGPEAAYHSDRQSFATVIDKVYVSDLPVAVVGDAITKGEDGNVFPVKVPADANYTAYAWWGLSNGEEMTEDTFQSGKSYDLYVEFIPKEGYEFSDSLIVNDDGIDYGDNGASKTWAMYLKTYSFRKVIDKLQVDGVKKPVIGEKASVDTLKVPADANYVISSAVWLDYNTGEQAVVYENGHEYYLGIWFEPKEGYEFGLYADIIVDGVDCSERLSVMPEEAHISYGHTSFETLISEIRVDNVPEMKVGDKATLAATVPTDANYSIAHMAWMVWNDKSESFEEFTGTFEAGKLYELNIDVVPNPGYKFDEDATVICVNGAVDESLTAYEDGFSISKTYTNGLKVVDRVEFTVVEPVVGNHSSIPPQVIVSADANYYVEQEYDLEWFFEKNGRYNSFYGYFDENTSYGVSFWSIPAEGYVFAEDLVVVVNGVVLSKDDIDVSSKGVNVDYIFGTECEHIYGDWSDAKDGTHTRVCTVCGHKVTEEHVYTDASGTKCSVCGAAKNDGSPKTSDPSNVMNIFALMAMCGIGVLAVDRRKKKIN